MENYENNKNEIVSRIIDLKNTIEKEKKPRKKRESKKPKLPTFTICKGPVVVKFE
jgi:hypothetical protein